MCGITGILYFDRREISQPLLEIMTEMMHHRGPDDTGFFIEEGIGFGFKRLSIIDLKEGHQPLANEDESLWIVFNGEIYNYKYLRNHLMAKGHRFKTETDTEVLVHLYEEYGTDCLQHLRGMFAFAIWDKRRKELFCARDFFGIKPFYYYYDAEQFIFGSEIKSILAVEGIKKEVRPESLLNYLTFQYVPDPDTMFQQIRRLPPAHYLLLKQDGKMTIKKYWDPMLDPKNRSLDDYIEELRFKLEDSVKHHMQSDVKRGCFLSSGIDSTTIAALMRKVEPIKTFSVGFEGPNNECLIARQTAVELGTEYYDYVISPKEYFDKLPEVIWHQDEPVADPSAVTLYFVAKLAREHVTVVLSGEGADEIFGGYRIYRDPLLLRPFDFIPLEIKRHLHRLFKRLPNGMKGRNMLLRATTPLAERFFGNALLFSEDDKRQATLFSHDFLTDYKNPVQIAGAYYDRVKHLDAPTQMQYIDLNLWLPGDILAKADKMTMAHSLELRVPFLDKEVFELARSIPTEYRLAKGTTKFILRKAMKGIIPESIVDRPKLGFPVPLREWLKGKYAYVLLEQLDVSAIGSYFNRSYIMDMIAKHRAGEGDFSRKIWAVYIFSLWYQVFVVNQSRLLREAEENLRRERVQITV